MLFTTLALSQTSTHLTPRARRIRALAATVLIVGVATTEVAKAQVTTEAASNNRWEFMMSSGALVPTGAQRNVLKDAQLSTAQLSYSLNSTFAVTAMTGWARSRDIATLGNPKLDVFTYDVGVEARGPKWSSASRIAFKPLGGVGVGARSYNYRKLDVDATHNVAAYGTIGGELGAGRVRVRLEVRDYVTGFKPLDGIGSSATRNDLVGMLGLRLVRRGA